MSERNTKLVFSDKDKDRMVQMYRDDGYSTYDIGRRYGCSRFTVQNILRERGVEIRPRGKRAWAG